MERFCFVISISGLCMSKTGKDKDDDDDDDDDDGSILT
jgi:hypothetical protein